MGSNPSKTDQPRLSADKEQPALIVVNGHQPPKELGKLELEGSETKMSAEKFDPEIENDVSFDADSMTVAELLEKSKICMEKIKGVQNDRTANGIVTVEFRKSASALLEIVNVCSDRSTDKTETLQKLTKYAIEYQTVDIYCRLSSEILEGGNTSAYPGIVDEQIEPLDDMISFLVDFTDNNAEISKAVSNQTRFLETTIKKLHQWKDIYCSEMDDEETILGLLCTVLHNVAMFEDNVPKIRSIECIDAMKLYLDSKDNLVRLVCLATLADIVNESESEILKSNGDVIKFLLWSISMAMADSSRSWDGWSLPELARIVRQVARNDNNKKTVVKHGAVPILLKLAGSDDLEEQRESLAALWTLTFDEQNRKEMIQNKEWKVTETLEKLSKSSDATVAKTSKKALWTIKGHEEHCSNGKSNGMQTTTGDTHVMISYNWGNQKMVKQIRDHLRNNGFKVWMDVDDMQGSTLQAMASAVENADIVLVCYSLKYKNSDNCRAEAEYAFQLKKKIIPLRMEQNYKADGWLGFIIGAKIFYDFSGKYPFVNKAAELVREVRDGLNSINRKIVAISDKPIRPEREPTIETSIQVMSGFKPKPQKINAIDMVKKWTPSQVEKWLDINSLPKKLLGRLRGKDIAFLSLLVHESPSTFYQVLKDQLGVKDFQAMSDFRFAMEDFDIDVGTSSSL